MAIKEQDKVFYEEAENGDKIINLPVTRVNNVEGIGRSANTAYSVGNVVYTDSNLSVALKCTTAGTTSDGELDISGNAIGDTVTDGSVTWQVCNRTSDVTSVNGQTGDVTTDTFPVGAILPFSGDTVPVGYLTCDGAAVSRTLYADLFAVIGTTYGVGDGSTTFNLPNLNNNSFLEGSDTVGTVKSAGLPNITGSFWGGNSTYGASKGAFSDATSTEAGCGSGAYKILGEKKFDASCSNAIYGNSTTVQPKSVTVKYIIKAFASITNGGNVDAENIMSAVEGLQSGLNTTAAQITGISDYIIESYRNGTEWYEVYKNGKVRQGGEMPASSGSKTVTLLKTMANTNYKVITTCYGSAESQYAWGQANTKTTTTFKTMVPGSGLNWEVEGQGA